MKQDRATEPFLEQLRKVPIIQYACEKTGIARSTIYRWMEDDPEFKKAVESALAEGEAFINDLTESQLITMIKEKNFPAISLWLKSCHPKFRPKLDLSATLQAPQEELTPEQAETVREALKLAGLMPEGKSNEPNQEPHTNDQQPRQSGTSSEVQL